MISIQTSLKWFISVLRVHSARLAKETSLLECIGHFLGFRIQRNMQAPWWQEGIQGDTGR